MLVCLAKCWTYLECVPRASKIMKQLYASIDTTLTPPRAQYCATLGNPQKGKPFGNAEFATLSKPLQRMNYHS
jgi:hypothetical protein